MFHNHVCQPADGVADNLTGFIEVITGFHNQYIKIKFDGDAKAFPGVFHPTDCMRYIT